MTSSVEANPYAPPTTAPVLRELESLHRRSDWLNGLLLLHGLVILVAIAAQAFDIESILVSGPILALVGFVIALFAFRQRDIAATQLGVSAIAFALLIVILINYYHMILINYFEWGPRSAEGPVRILSCIYAIFAFPAAMWLFYRRSVKDMLKREEP
jgi:hypothetical protein